MEYELIGGHIIPEPVARALDVIAWHSRAYPGPSYEERCLQLARKRAAECKTDAQRRITDRNTDPSLQALNRKAPD